MAERDPVDAVVEQWAAERPELQTQPIEVFERIFRIAKTMGDRLDSAYAEFGIGRGEFDVLAALRRSGEPFILSPSQLASSVMVTTGGMTGRLDRLERAGLLDRVPDASDRRTVRARLTDKGRDLVDLAIVAGLERQRAALEALPPDQRELLADLLGRLLAGFSSPG